MRILLLNHQQNKTAAGQVWLSHSTAIYLTSPTLSFLICKVEMGFTPTRVPSKPGSGLPAQSRVWRPCRWQVLQSLSVQRSNRCQPSLASRGHCHAMQTVPASACRTGSSPQGGPPRPHSCMEEMCYPASIPLSERLPHPLDRVTESPLRPAFRLWRIQVTTTV